MLVTLLSNMVACVEKLPSPSMLVDFDEKIKSYEVRLHYFFENITLHLSYICKIYVGLHVGSLLILIQEYN